MNETNDRSSDLVPVAKDVDTVPNQGYFYPDYSYSAEAGADTDLERLAHVLWQRKLWIIGALLVGTAIGYMATRFLTPSYEARATIWIEAFDQQRGGPIRADDPLAGEGFADVFRTRAVVQPVVEDRQLYLRVIEPETVDPDYVDNYQVGSESYPGIYTLRVSGQGNWSLERDGDGVVQTGSAGQLIGAPAGFSWLPPVAAMRPGEEIRFSLTTPQQAAIELIEALSVRYNPNSQLIEARLTRSDPAEAAAILNQLAEQFLQTATDLKAQKVRQEVEMLEEQTEFTRQRLEAAELALENHRIAAITLPTDPEVTPVAGGQIGLVDKDPVFDTFFQTKLSADQLQSDIAQLERILAAVDAGDRPNTMALQSIQSAQTSVELQAAITQLYNAEVQRRTLLQVYTEDHPDVRRYTSEVDAVELTTIPTIIRDIVGQATVQLDLLNQQITAQTSELRQIPTRTIEGARRQREVLMAEQLHNMLLVRLKEAQLAEATTGPGISIIERAWPPSSPMSNSAPRIIVLCAMACLGLGFAGVLLHDRLDKRIRYPDQVTGSLGLPVLGVVPQLKASTPPGGPAAAIAIESFRGLRTQIAHVDGRIDGIHLVTSPAPREGKSMVAANLAISFATAGHSTVLVDGDTRRGRAQDMFQLARSPGLTDILLERASLTEATQQTEVDNLALISRGSSRGFNADLLDGARMDDLLEALRADYEIVVIDGPPLAAGADVLMLGQRSDKVMLVLRAGATREDLARAKLETMGNVQIPIIGAVLNAMPKSTPYYDHYVHYYYADAELAS